MRALGAWMPASATATASALFRAYSTVRAPSFCANCRAGCILCPLGDSRLRCVGSSGLLRTSRATERLRQRTPLRCFSQAPCFK